MYKDKKDMTTFVDIENVNGVVKLKFTSYRGKFGTEETLDSFILSPELLLKMLQDYD